MEQNKTQISASVVADSKNEFGNRITTMVVTFPRIILAEFNTHRMFSRNSASSRAIPFEKMVKSVEENPFIPIAWQKDHKGMQGTEYFTDNFAIDINRGMWLVSRDEAIKVAKNINAGGIGVSKQLCNRLLEPFMWHTVIVTATEWENFFALRCPQYSIPELSGIFRSKKDYIKASREQNNLIEKIEDYTTLQWLQINKGQAEIHMMALAEAMWDVYNESTPKELKAGEWHIPFYEQDCEEFEVFCLGAYATKMPIGILKDEPLKTIARIKLATTRAARTSYTVVGDDLKPLSYQRQCELHDGLVSSNPLHASPLEHCAKNPLYVSADLDDNTHWSGNFKGFIQYRKMLPNENITK